MNGMEQENECRQVCPGDCESSQNGPEKKGVAGMKKHIDKVIPQRAEVPQVVFKPKGREDHGIVLNRCTWFKPDPFQPLEIGQNRVVGHIDIVVPDVPPRKGREIRSQREEGNKCGRRESQRNKGADQAISKR